ncbi:MAG TPA: phosphate acyltransferase PlsX [Anaerolineales bacterium]|nr:phosphate acyltransferase PlsX [Anaerolineales bacterium]
MRIVVDAMGSDRYPIPDVEGAVLAARAYGVEIILVGDEAVVRPALEATSPGKLPVTLLHAPELLTMQDKGLSLALKAKRKEPKTSMALGIDLVRNRQADAFVTAGNTGAAATTAYFRLGMLAGVDRPALAPVFPTRSGSCIVLDVGANPDCKPEHLLQFAIMGQVYAERVRGVGNPRIGLLSNGEEPGKGNLLVRETYPLLQASGLNFIGNVEGKEVFAGAADVVVTDGFSGNILLKSAEAVGALILDIVREKIQAASPAVKVGGLLVRPALRSLRKMLDPSEEGAAPLLGVDGLVFIGHGRSDALAIQNAVRVAKLAADAGVLESVRAEISRRLTPAPAAA